MGCCVHIVFNVNDSYIKYLAVLCFSIIQNSKPHHVRDKKSYTFHLLTDGLLKDTKVKISQLQKRLNQIHPCRFIIYTLSDEDFVGLPKLCGNYLTYFRLKLGSFLPKEIKKVLYLDVDMLCVGDIREIFEMDLGGRVLGAVIDAHYTHLRIMQNKDSHQEGLRLNVSTYFNAGLLFIDLEEWRSQKIEEQLFAFLKSYIPQWHDQDTLNAVLSDKLLILPLQWNFMLGHFEANYANFDGKYRTLAYSKETYLKAKQEAKIWHFLTPQKPWNHVIQDVNPGFIEYVKKYREIALQTPIFSYELQKAFDIESKDFFMTIKGFLIYIRHFFAKLTFKGGG